MTCVRIRREECRTEMLMLLLCLFAGWQLPPPRIPPAASPAARMPSKLSPASTRTASSSSTSTATASPLGNRLLQVSQPQHSTRLTSPLKSSNTRTSTLPPPVTVTKTNVRRGGRPSLPAMPLSSDARPGRFEAEFVEAGEIGSGEFGKVMRVRLKVPLPTSTCSGDEETEWAVKRSKRFEGARHRYVHCSPFRYFVRPDLGFVGGRESRHALTVRLKTGDIAASTQ